MSGFNPIYKGGGFNSHLQKLTNISFASIADKINRGDSSIVYTSVDATGVTGPSNDFLIELIKPEQELKVSTFGVDEDSDRPTIFSTSAESIGSKTKFLNRSYIAPITRYNGNYSPRVYDVISFVNGAAFKKVVTSYYEDEQVEVDSVDALIDNVTFGINQPNFGLIKNMYYNKVNERNPRAILELDRTGGFNPVYPKIDEVAIDYRDFDVFKSNWDSDYYIENIDKSNIESRLGTRSMLEKRTFFGSKMMNLPEQIELDSFDIIDINNQIEGMEENQKLSTNKAKLELQRDRIDVDLTSSAI
jgi:hypothetical protein